MPLAEPQQKEQSLEERLNALDALQDMQEASLPPTEKSLESLDALQGTRGINEQIIKPEIPDLKTIQRMKMIEAGTFQPPKTIGQQAVDVGKKTLELLAAPGEAGLAIATGIPAFMANFITSLGKGISDIAQQEKVTPVSPLMMAPIVRGLMNVWKTGGRDTRKLQDLAATLGQGRKLGGEITQPLAYQPVTPLGQTTADVAIAPINTYIQIIDKIAQDATSDPNEQRAIRMLGDALLLVGGPKVAIKGVKSLGKRVALRGKMPVEPTLEQVGNQVGDVFIKGKQTFKIKHVERDPEEISEMTGLIKQLKPLGRKQKVMYGQEFKKRISEATTAARKLGGEAGWRAKLSKMKGEYEKIAPDFEALRKVLSEEKIDAVRDTIEYNPFLLPGEKLHAGEGFAKLLEGKFPQPKQLELLQTVFGVDFVKTILQKRPLLSRAAALGLELANVPRSLMAGLFDLSFGGRQGWFGAARYYKEFAAAWKKQFGAFGAEKAYRAVMDMIIHDPYFKLAKEAKVDFTELGAIMFKREERYLSPFAEKIPLIGRGIRMTGRAYTAFANKYRMDIFKRLAKDAENMGHKPEGNTELLRSIGSYINVVTGRGKLGRLEPAGSILNAVFFSPRLWSSRMGLVLGKYNPLNPAHYLMLPKFVRLEALKTWLAFAGANITLVHAAKLAGAEVETDPTSPDFMKIKIGNTRLSFWSGLQPQVRTMIQFITGRTKSSVTGKIRKIGKGYKPLTRGEILGRYISYKEAPVASFVTNWLRGQSSMQDTFSITKEMKEKLIPIVAQDIWDIYQDDPDALPLGLLAIFGYGVQTYKKKKRLVQ